MEAGQDPPVGMGAPPNDQGQPAPDAPPVQGSLPVNKSPEWLMDVLYEAVYFVQAYGWFIVGGAVLLYFLWTRVRARFYALRDDMTARQEARSVDPAVLAARQEAMAAARERLQLSTSDKAAEYAVKQKEIEDRKRQERIEDWERQRTGRSPLSRTLRSGAKDEASGKPRRRPLKPDSGYNPLMGGGGGGGYKPSRSRPGGAGGGGGGG